MNKPLTSSESTVKPSEPIDAQEAISILGLDEPVITNYFALLNAGDFQATSQLFALDGVLQPPFEETIVGPEAIVAYLEKEAKGFLLHPQQGTERIGEDGNPEIEVVGKVQTPWFSVNVRWLFSLNEKKALLRVQVKLLAAMKDLLQLRSDKESSENLDRRGV